jgi:hypothetical protein
MEMTDINYEKYLVKEPIIQNQPASNVQNRTFPPLIYLSSAQIPEIKYNIEFGWVWGMPQPNPYLDERVGEYDEILLNIGGDCYNPEELGADIEYSLGGQILSIDSTSAVFIPKGVRHGTLKYKEFRHPHVRISILLGTGEREYSSASDLKTGTEYDTNIDYEKYLVRKPTYEVIASTPVKNRQEPASMTFMNRNLVPECNIYVEGGWVFGMPDPNPHIFEHVHRDFEELVLHFGTDYEHPEELGGEIDFSLGGQSLKLDKTALIYVPKGISHGPLIWKRYSAPHLEMAMIPGAGSLAEADPGGHQEKMQKEGSE